MYVQSSCRELMETYQGDLADIVRASGGAIGSNTSAEPPTAASDWQFPSINPMNHSSGQIEERPGEDFGDPFSIMGDPLLHDIDMPTPGFYKTSPEDAEGFPGGGVVSVGNNSILDERKRPASNIFSRMQISPSSNSPVLPCDSPVGLKAAAPMLVSNDHRISQNSFEGCLGDSPPVQISSPRNTGIKRRKSQAKKVVCIPAPAPASSRPSGEIVPSDLWAWRKYGQKPIKGSPYPRGYYRCSSSKGCSARKQVERSRTDPNMLVITYTSEHNHPWPTQRNALAGSTRSLPSKNNSSVTKNSSRSDHQAQKSTNQKEREITAENVSSPAADGNSTSDHPSVKEENGQDSNSRIELAGDDIELNEGFPQSYKPALPAEGNHSEDFFSDLGEIETDPLDLFFTQGLSGDYGEEQKALNPFSFFGWSAGNSNNTSFGEANMD